MKKRTGLMLAIAGLGLVLAGCDKSGSVTGGNTMTVDALTGKWVATKSHTTGTATVTLAGQPPTASPVNDTQTYTDDNVFVNFHVHPNTYDANFPAYGPLGGPESGTWTLSGNTITAVSSTGNTTKMEADIDGGAGVFTITLDRTSDVSGNAVNFKGTSVLTVARK